VGPDCERPDHTFIHLHSGKERLKIRLTFTGLSHKTIEPGGAGSRACLPVVGQET
jgi:hypothetical protein